MGLVEGYDRLDLLLQGSTVSRCCVDYSFAMDFLLNGQTAHIRIEGRFFLRYKGNELELSAGEAQEEVGKAAVLFNKMVDKAFALRDGGLQVSFLDGTELAVPVDPHFEAWQFVGTRNFRVVSLPGGGLAIWGPDQL